jgi:hypothetical protein
MSIVRAANAAAGNYWFERSTMRFFRSRVGRVAYRGAGGVYFVSSEQFIGSDGRAHARKFTVRRQNVDGSIDTVGAFNELDRVTATRVAKEHAAGLGAAGDRPSDSTWENQLRHAQSLATSELKRHAAVSAENRHRCQDCFCCAAWAVLEERAEVR